MIPHQYRFYVFSFIMSLFMSGAMSLAFLSLEHMEVATVLQNWPLSWSISMLIAFPMSLFVVPLTDTLVNSVMMKDVTAGDS